MASKGSESITIGASPERVYNLLIDLANLDGISPEFQRAEWLEGLTGPHAGATFRAYPRDGGDGVPCRVLRAMPGEEFAFKTNTTSGSPATWRYELERDGDGCTV
ncbi:MAG TPA: SRPBCC family protein, partial [Acidimicrobiales bacterium]